MESSDHGPRAHTHSIGAHRLPTIGSQGVAVGIVLGCILLGTAPASGSTGIAGSGLEAVADAWFQAKLRHSSFGATGVGDPRFDDAMDHRQLLRHGALPLDVLDRELDRWMGTERAGPPGGR